MPSAPSSGFSRAQIGLHWGIAVLVGSQLLFGESMKRAVDAAAKAETISPIDLLLATSHYWFGIAILVLVAMRLYIRFTRGVPAHRSQPPVLQLAATATHWIFYALLIAVPIVGLLAYYVGDPWGDIHSLAKPVFLTLIALHAGAALLHHFVLRDGTLRRILVPAQ